ncbi:uncharacterized protein LOC120544724 [Perca fluviatilis]|uniref:uncharacterized protein LOC120544724 n=1 Tax=Perca fluviatilis TaxID=8168 RepID=UPI0019665BE1|nr:uncharacterized protein LOC120544724 [Perca fluviatilis]
MEMASRPRRRRSRDFPPDFSELMNTLKNHAASFIREFGSREQKMREIVREFREISDGVRKMQEITDRVRTVGAVTGGVGIGLSVLAALFTGGVSLAVVLLVAAAGGAVTGAGGIGLSFLAAMFTGGVSLAVVPLAAVAGGAAAAGKGVVFAVNVTKRMKETGSAKKVEELGKEFMEIVEPLKKDLEEIKRTCEKLEERSAGDQAGITLRDMEGLQRILTRVSELAERSEEVVFVTATLMGIIRCLILLLVTIFRVTATPEEDKKLRNSIIQSAVRCQEVVVKFDQMKKELKDLTTC